MQNIYRGISFPFRIGNKGGVVMSSASPSDARHIEESIRQILSTREFERTMEYHFFSDIDSLIFEPNDQSTRTLLEYQVRKALELDTRILVSKVSVYSEGEKIFATIYYSIKIFSDSQYTFNLEIGGN